MEESWYKLSLTAGQVISVTLAPAPDVDFEVRLYGPDERLLESGHSPKGEPAEINYSAGETGVFYIKVDLSSGEGNYQVSLDVQNQNDAGSGEDASDYGIQAYPIGPGTFSGFLKDDDDEDWYRFDITKGQIISANLSVPSDADFDFTLYRPSGSSAESGYSSKGESAALSYVAEETGVHFIKVNRSSGEGNYQLNLNISGQGTHDYWSNVGEHDYATDDTKQET